MPVPDRVSKIQLVSYADDMSVAKSGKDVDALYQGNNGINQYLGKVTTYLHERKLEVSAAKSSVTLFTPYNPQLDYHPPVLVNGNPVPLVKRPKILGLTHDQKYNFTPHIDNVVATGRKKNNILKALAGTSWGQQKETLLTVYKATGRSTLEYVSPVWSPVISDTNWGRLQRVQNEALRTATGCHRMADMAHLHRETKILPIRPHAEMIIKQYLLSCLQPQHPNYQLSKAPRPPRPMKETLTTKFGAVIRQAAATGQLTTEEYKAAKSAVHTETVRATISQYPVNKTLNRPPPEIDKSETALPRASRSKLAQLRSGHSKLLNSYNARVTGVPNSCPDCNGTPHDSAHLFDCPARPTTLELLDLWRRPSDVALFLGL